jgi:hypothetical protein
LAFCIGLGLLAGLAFSTYLLVTAVYLPAGFILAACFALVPALYALMQYSYCSPGIWANTEPGAEPNGGSTKPLDNSRGADGRPSVSSL